MGIGENVLVCGKYTVMFWGTGGIVLAVHSPQIQEKKIVRQHFLQPFHKVGKCFKRDF